jgi:dTDP-4-amino-4,6-dideoxygalactose transaminase
MQKMTKTVKHPEKIISPIQFIDLKAQQECIRPQIDAAIKRVLDHGIYIMGPEVYELEKQLAAFCGVKHAISCANGTDALGLGLMAMRVRPGDAVFVPSFTFAATAEVVAWMGATPVFIDSLEDTYNIDPKSLEQGIQTAKKAGLKPAGIIPVDLFGQPADYDAIEAIANEYKLWVMADGAQSFGASYKGRKVGNIGDLATTSFFPAKPLGCYGDGGAVFTNDDSVANIIKSLRVHGQGSDKYDNVRIGMNGRLDTIQAAILIEKLKVFSDELIARQQTADIYNTGLKDIVRVPYVIDEATSAWAQYTVRLPKNINRNSLIADLKKSGIPTMVYYVKPLHLQTAYSCYLTATGKALPVCETLANEVLSLPMSGYLHTRDQKLVINYFIDSFKMQIA